MTFNVDEFSNHHNSKIIFSSSREVYLEVQDRVLLKEEDYGIIDLLDKRSSYPESKRASETILNSYYLQFKIPYISLRIAHCYGPGMKISQDGRVMQDFIGNAVKGEDIVLKSDGKALRAFCYISDIIRAILKLSLNAEIGRAYNLSNENEEISVGDLAERIAAIEGGIRVVKDNSNSDSAMYCSYKRVGLDCSEAYKYGWQPIVTLNEGLKKTIESFKL